MMAALSGSKPMVELLLKAGADVTTRDTKGQNAADWATTGKSTKLAAELRELIARQDRDKQARRAAAPAEAESVDDAALQAVAPAGAGRTQRRPAWRRLPSRRRHRHLSPVRRPSVASRASS